MQESLVHIQGLYLVKTHKASGFGSSAQRKNRKKQPEITPLDYEISPQGDVDSAEITLILPHTFTR
jgi:hypothetical protein